MNEELPIGTKVVKKSRKPFKSGEKIATIKGYCVNPQSPKNRPAYLFDEDDSCVEIQQVEQYK